MLYPDGHYDVISTHAPLARCDPAPSIGRRRMLISTHAPLARCDKTEMVDGQKQKISTHAPLARCDKDWVKLPWFSYDFNSRTSCEVRRGRHCGSTAGSDFNSRTSCEVRRPVLRALWSLPSFQLTHLLRGATRHDAQRPSAPVGISTHAPLARCDQAVEIQTEGEADFNSRTSCEVRRNCAITTIRNFISTHAPLARCDIFSALFTSAGAISTHAPLARCDGDGRGAAGSGGHFNSRTSCEVRRWTWTASTPCCAFQLTHLLRGATATGRGSLGRTRISTHAPLARCDGLPV